MKINNIQPPTSYINKSSNGYGLLYTDTFEPAESSLQYTFRDSINGVTITGTDGTRMEGLSGPIVELWNIDVDQHPFIDIEIKFDSGLNQVSTPIFYGFSLGSEYGITFNDLTDYRDFEINDGVLEFEYDDDSKRESNVIYVNSSDLVGDSNGYDFSKPIYGLLVTGVSPVCNPNLSINHAHTTEPQSINFAVINNLTRPIYDFDLKIELNADCDLDFIWLNLKFGEHFDNIELDFGADGVNEWDFSDPAYGKFGLQTNFYAGENNGISRAVPEDKLTLDPLTGEVVGGFSLCQSMLN